jgi:hypothetical protein
MVKKSDLPSLIPPLVTKSSEEDFEVLDFRKATHECPNKKTGLMYKTSEVTATNICFIYNNNLKIVNFVSFLQQTHSNTCNYWR